MKLTRDFWMFLFYKVVKSDVKVKVSHDDTVPFACQFI